MPNISNHIWWNRKHFLWLVFTRLEIKHDFMKSGRWIEIKINYCLESVSNENLIVILDWVSSFTNYGFGCVFLLKVHAHFIFHKKLSIFNGLSIFRARDRQILTRQSISCTRFYVSFIFFPHCGLCRISNFSNSTILSGGVIYSALIQTSTKSFNPEAIHISIPWKNWAHFYKNFNLIVSNMKLHRYWYIAEMILRNFKILM